MPFGNSAAFSGKQPTAGAVGLHRCEQTSPGRAKEGPTQWDRQLFRPCGASMSVFGSGPRAAALGYHLLPRRGYHPRRRLADRCCFGAGGSNFRRASRLTPERAGGLDGRAPGGGFGDRLAEKEFGEGLAGGGEALRFDGGEDPLLGHDEAVAFVEDVILAQVGGSEIDGDEVCPGAKAAAVTAAGFGEVEGADGGNDPVGSHQAQGGHAVQGQVDVRSRVVGQGCFVAGYEGADAATCQGELSGQIETGEKRLIILAGVAGDKS